VIDYVKFTKIRFEIGTIDIEYMDPLITGNAGDQWIISN